MTARIFIVHDDSAFSEEARSALESAGHSVAIYDDPMVALDALETAQQINLLITRANFGVGKAQWHRIGSNGSVQVSRHSGSLHGCCAT
jgi:DNA-binding NtrC family response regulator